MTTRLLGAGLPSFPKAEEGIISGIPRPIDAEVPALRKPRRFVFILDKIQIPPKEINHYTNKPLAKLPPKGRVKISLP
tara:strand:- start:65 stop:298 length:234 start_codon:yes stop_codon:yes gene_type:complete